jgi:hypothetical protein
MSSSPRLLSCFLAVTVALAAWACRTGGKAAPSAPAAAEAPAFVQALVGQQRIMLTGGESKASSRRRGEAPAQADACDVAVEIRQASFQGGTLNATLVHLGQPRLDGAAQRRGKPCPTVAESAFTLGGFTSDMDAAAIEAEVGRVLQTPEGYLTTAGLKLEKPAEVVEGIAATGQGTSTAPERNLARQVTTWPKRLLWVDAAVPAPKKDLRRESEVEVRGVVTTDGQFAEPTVLTPLAAEHMTMVKRGLSLWRFAPARAGEKAISARTSARLSLRMY